MVMMMIQVIVVIVIAVRAVMMVVMMPTTLMVMVIIGGIRLARRQWVRSGRPLTCCSTHVDNAESWLANRQHSF